MIRETDSKNGLFLLGVCEFFFGSPSMVISKLCLFIAKKKVHSCFGFLAYSIYIYI